VRVDALCEWIAHAHLFTRVLRVGQVLALPIAHGMAGSIFNQRSYARIERAGLDRLQVIATRQAVDPGQQPDGDLHNIAGVRNNEGNVVGPHPHPEEAAEALLSPFGWGVRRVASSCRLCCHGFRSASSLKAEQLGLGLTSNDCPDREEVAGRGPRDEWSIIDRRVVEHSSLQVFGGLLKSSPTDGERVVLGGGSGYDAGVVDVGDGYVSHVCTSRATTPFRGRPDGGASTGIAEC